jgi:hypothetical protein
MRVIDRVHCRTTNLWALPHVARASGFADLQVLVINVGYLSNGGHAGQRNKSHLGGRHAHGGELALLRNQLCGGASGTNHLATLPWYELNVVNRGAERHARER